MLIRKFGTVSGLAASGSAGMSPVSLGETPPLRLGSSSMNWGSRAGEAFPPEPGAAPPGPGAVPPEGESVPGFGLVGFGGPGEGVGAGLGAGAGSPVADEQSGSPGWQEAGVWVARAVARPGAGGPEGVAADAGKAAHIAKKSSNGKVAEIATERFRRVDLEPCATWWFPTKTDTADTLPRCG